jgi:hypothetical protein
MSESDLFPDIDPVNPFPDDKKITRYMSLHAFIMLLTGKVFIPSVKKLQQVDPVESLLPSLSIPDFPERCRRLHEKENAEWLQKQAPQTTSQDHDKQRLIEVWLRELAVRRCIWCWFGDRGRVDGLMEFLWSAGCYMVAGPNWSVRNRRA